MTSHTRRTAAAAVLAALALTGCGSTTADTKPAAKSAPAYTDLRDLASALGCSGSYAHDSEPMMYASDSASCTLPGGADVALNLFNNDEARDKYVAVGAANGAAYVVGRGWLVECQDRAAQDEAAKATGGERKR